MPDASRVVQDVSLIQDHSGRFPLQSCLGVCSRYVHSIERLVRLRLILEEAAGVLVVRRESSDIVFHARLNPEAPLLGAFELECEVLLEVDVEVGVIAFA